MSLSDQVRPLFVSSILDPARRSGQHIISVAVSDLNRQLGWKDRYPLICSALRAQKFQCEAGLKLEGATTPCPSSSTVMTFRLI